MKLTKEKGKQIRESVDIQFLYLDMLKEQLEFYHPKSDNYIELAAKIADKEEYINRLKAELVPYLEKFGQ